MGLDVTHVKLTREPIEKGDYYLLDEWESCCNVPLKHYEKFITDVEVFDFDKTIAIFNNEADLEQLKRNNLFNEQSCMKIFIGKIDERLKKQVKSYIAREGLDKLEMLQLGTEVQNVKYHDISFGKKIMRKGFYLKVIGTQRKGMDPYFYKEFKRFLLYGKKEDFELAYSCVGNKFFLETFGKEEVQQMRNNFRKNFIDNYVFGESLLEVSF